jgi:hypothetical protein
MFGRSSKLFSGRKKPGRKATFKSQFEALEKREVMSVTSIGTVAVISGVLADPYGPQPTAAGLALINGLADTPVRSTALADYQRDGFISRNDMIDIFSTGTVGFTNITAPEIYSLGTLVYNGPTVLAMPDYVQNLAWKCFNGIGVGGQAGALILRQNVDNFFLGRVHPDATFYSYPLHAGWGDPPPPEKLFTGTYSQVNLPLWNGAPRYWDVVRGAPDDSWLLSSLSELAYEKPGDIMKMFIVNGDGTYTIRFYNGSTPDYVTVDNYLPFVTQNVYVGAHSPTSLWVALVEKAYVQENAASSSYPGGSYQDELDGYHRDPTLALAAIEGPVGSSSSFGQATCSTNMNPLAITQAWSQGGFVVLNAKYIYPFQPDYYALVSVDISGGWFYVADNKGGLFGVQYSDLSYFFRNWMEADPAPAAVSAITWPQATFQLPSVGASAGLAAPLAISVTGFPSPTTAGVAGTITVTARDTSNNIATGYRGTVHFTSSDSKAVLPADYTFTATDQGVHTFSVTLKTAGRQSLTATDITAGSIACTRAGIVVSPAAARTVSIKAPASVTKGVAFSLTVTLLDAYGNVATGYTGTVHFRSSDGSALLPPNYTFTAADAGVHTFVNKTTLRSQGRKTVTVTDTLNSALTGTDIITVT